MCLWDVYTYACHSVHVEVRGQHFGAISLFPHLLGSRGGTTVVRLHNKYVYLLSHLSGPLRQVLAVLSRLVLNS